MFRMKKDGIVRIVATEAEAERWEDLGYYQRGNYGKSRYWFRR